MGFKNINMDLIAALPGEGAEQFARAIEVVADLSPEGVTVHALALKRASRLREAAFEPTAPELAAEMISLARTALTSAGYRPYYLYRQKYMAGNLENVGYAKPGFECLYNIGHMEETARVLAMGAGGITKWLFPRERRIERAPNVRDVREYIDRVDEMAARKRRLIFC
jgi:oxygen-independent coproporphyrinogen-3 oxidase